MARNLRQLLAQGFNGKSFGWVVHVVAEPIRDGMVDFIYAVQHVQGDLLLSPRRVRQKEFSRVDRYDRIDQC